MHNYIIYDFLKNQLKKINHSLICLSLLTLISLGLNAQTYCTPTFPTSMNSPNVYGVIYKFSTADAVVDISNTTVGQQMPSGYEDFSATHQAQVTAGTTFDIIVEPRTASGCSVSAWIDWNNDGVFSASEQVLAVTGATGGTNTASGVSLPYNPAIATITVPANQPSGTYRIRAMTRFGPALPPIDDACFDGINATPLMLGDCEDYAVVVLSDGPSCPPIANILKNNETIYSVDLSWTIGGSETSWDIQWGIGGFNPQTNTGTLVGSATSNTPNYSITGLTVDTNYQIFVRADCSGGETSTWRETSYLPSYCSATSVWDDIGINTQIASFSTTGGVDNISNLNSGISPNGYGNFTNMVVSIHAGGSIDFSLQTMEQYLPIGIWIDWNSNGVFEDEERVFYDQENGSANDIITVPAGQPLGDYRMRTRVEFGPDVLDPGPPPVLAFYPCGEIVLGETEDYTFRVVPPPVCLPITALNASGVTQTSTTISWTAGGTETLWNIEYGPAGFTQGSGTPSVVVDSSNSLTGLTAGTSYDVYVQADCGNGSQSTWVMTSFTTDAAFTCPSPLNAGMVTITPDSGSAQSTFDVVATGYDTGSDITYTWEKSEDNGANWTIVGTANNSVYTDLIGEIAPDSGVVSYRLTVACGGNTESSAIATFTVTVGRVDFDLYGFSYYPNPVNDILYFSSNQSIENVVVSNLLGQTLDVHKSSDNKNLDMSNLPTGNYLVKITIEGVAKTIKVVKR